MLIEKKSNNISYLACLGSSRCSHTRSSPGSGLLWGCGRRSCTWWCCPCRTGSSSPLLWQLRLHLSSTEPQNNGITSPKVTSWASTWDQVLVPTVWYWSENFFNNVCMLDIFLYCMFWMLTHYILRTSTRTTHIHLRGNKCFYYELK